MSKGVLGLLCSALPLPTSPKRRPRHTPIYIKASGAVATRSERREIARARLTRVLGTHGAALGRTLEQKIADAGPYNQRIDPHILTEVRARLITDGNIVRLQRKGSHWFHLSDESPDRVAARIAEQEPVHQAVSHQSFTMRLGQAAEIAVFRALMSQSRLESLGRFLDLASHDDSTLYRKEEPPGAIGSFQIPDDRKVDFLVRHPEHGWAAIEVKNVREWLYPDRAEVKDLLAKSLYLNAVPVLIARRIPYVTRRVLKPCGLLAWEFYNQLYPTADAALADQARHKLSLGFHDIRVGNEPPAPLARFISDILPDAITEARASFDEHRDLLEAYALHDMPYLEFAARVRRRELGQNEDHDWEDDNRPNDFEW